MAENATGAPPFDLRAATGLDAGAAAGLEAWLRANPGDLDARRRLLVYYQTGLHTGVLGPDAIAARRAHVLWLVEHRPEAPLAGSHEARLWPGSPGVYDEEGYEEARRLWLAHTRQPDVSGAVLANASRFLEVADKPLAEALLLRGSEREPDRAWSLRLGRFYAVVLLGDWYQLGEGGMTPFNLPELESSFTASVQRKLEESTDEVVLLAVAERTLTSPYPVAYRVGDHIERRHGSGLHELARPYLERALEVDPQSLPARVHLERVRHLERIYGPLRDLQRNVGLTNLHATASALPERERFDLFPELALHSYGRAAGAERLNDRHLEGYIATALAHSRAFAEDALDLAPRFEGHARYGSAIHRAHLALALLASRDGDTQAAVRHLRRSTGAPPYDELTYSTDLLAGELLLELLDAGAREAVAEYLDWYADINVPRRAEALDAAAAVRRGETPRLRWPGGPGSDLWVSRDLPV